MPTLNINGTRVKVGDEFLSLSPEEQEATVDEIASSLPTQAAGPSGAAAPVADSLTWGEVGEQAVQNIGPSLVQLGKDVAQPFLHPIDTANAVADIGKGALSLAGIIDADETAIRAVGQFYADRYGSLEGFKRAVAKDPAAVASDVGTILSGGALAGVKAGGTAGKVASIVGKVGDVVDPVSATLGAAGAAARAGGGMAARVLGQTTGVGSDAVREMARAGREGNAQALEQLRGGNPQDIVDDANAAMDAMRADRGAQYDTDMAGAFSDPTQLRFRRVGQALQAARDKVYPTGKMATDEAAADLITRAESLMTEAANSGARTARDFDTLKRRIDALGRGTDSAFAGSIAREISDALIETVSQRRPEYRTGLKGYENASKDLTELRKEFSLDSQNPNTSLRKLLSTFRQNSNLGRREELLRDMAKKQPQLPGMIAGREMAAKDPRGLARIATNPLIGGPVGMGMYAANPWLLALLPPTLAASTPRVVGEGAYAAGRVAGALNPAMTKLVSRTSYQTGRATRESQKDKKK